MAPPLIDQIFPSVPCSHYHDEKGMVLRYTSEQVEIFDRVKAGWSFVVEAGAGTGKTSTLAEAVRPLSEGSRNPRGLYMAYNRAIVADSAGAFPDWVDCRTAHSIAFRAVGHPYATMLRQGAVQGWQIAKALRVGPWKDGNHKLSGPAVASLARATVKRWAHSTSPNIEKNHVPVPSLIVEDDMRDSVQEYVMRVAGRIWNVAVSPEQRMLRFDPDWYLKIFSMSGADGGAPNLGMDIILFDECQDADPVIRVIFEGQACQRVAVGDSQQAIYGWRGAENAIDHFRAAGAPVLNLTTSWRFGEKIATEANTWLDRLDADIRLSGNPALDSELGSIDDEKRHAVLCYTNAGATEAAIIAQARSRKVAIVGCGDEVKSLIAACEKLYNGHEAYHSELVGFQTWGDLEDFVDSKDCDNPTLRTQVKLTRRYGIDEIKRAVFSCCLESEAEVIASTAHKSKGRQWGQVRIGSDFLFKDPRVDPKQARADLRLAYVAVTRARKVLDRERLVFEYS
jgi:hypothetical protein